MTLDVRLDLARGSRIGQPEAIFCESKSKAQIETILARLTEAGQSSLLTRLPVKLYEALSLSDQQTLDYDPISRTAFFNWSKPQQAQTRVAVIAAGSSDLPVAKEAMRTLEFSGITHQSYIDVGVAGLWRLLEHVDELQTYPVLIAVAGMEGALCSVLGGLVPGLIIVVPTSVGYGTARRGETALNAALTSCAQGLTVVNIDNGYGAACAAMRAINAFHSQGTKIG